MARKLKAAVTTVQQNWTFFSFGNPVTSCWLLWRFGSQKVVKIFRSRILKTHKRQRGSKLSSSFLKKTCFRSKCNVQVKWRQATRTWESHVLFTAREGLHSEIKHHSWRLLSTNQRTAKSKVTLITPHSDRCGHSEKPDSALMWSRSPRWSPDTQTGLASVSSTHEFGLDVHGI